MAKEREAEIVAIEGVSGSLKSSGKKMIQERREKQQ
jgi:hypothetical protein